MPTDDRALTLTNDETGESLTVTPDMLRAAARAAWHKAFAGDPLALLLVMFMDEQMNKAEAMAVQFDKVVTELDIHTQMFRMIHTQLEALQEMKQDKQDQRAHGAPASSTTQH